MRWRLHVILRDPLNSHRNMIKYPSSRIKINILTQQCPKSMFSDLYFVGQGIFSPSYSNIAGLGCHFDPASNQLAQRVNLVPNDGFLAVQSDPWQYNPYT